jgi:hypothetical protein
VLLTRAPLYRGRSPFSCDLHVLGAPLTFVLSQDQTLQLKLSSPRGAVLADGGARALALFELGTASTPEHECSGDWLSHGTHSFDPICRDGAYACSYDSVFKDRGKLDGFRVRGARF